MSAHMSHTILLTTLPDDILFYIVEHLIAPRYWTSRVKYEELKPLRLVCRHFADHDAVNKPLFKSIGLIASVENIEALETTNFQRLLPYIGRIAFFPPPQIWTVGMDTFKQLARSRVRRMSMTLRGDKARAGELEPKNKQYIADFLHHSDPFNDRHLQKSYKNYHKKAKEQQAILESGTATKQWAKFLDKLPTVKSFRIMQSGEGHPEEKNAPIGDALFSAVFQALVMAQRQPSKMKMEGFISPDCLDLSDRCWDILKLSELLKLSFGATVYERVRPENYRSNTGFTSRFVSWALDGPNHKLRKLSLMSQMIWPPSNPPPLSHLQLLKYGGAEVDSAAFATWLPQLTSLKTLTFQNVSATDRNDWKEIYYAIRLHPNYLHIHFDGIWLSAWMQDVCLEVDTKSDCEELLGRYTGVYTDPDKQDARDDFDDSSVLFLCGKIDWNTSLDVCTYGWDESDTEELDEIDVSEDSEDEEDDE
jgi:hypothetical protein